MLNAIAGERERYLRFKLGTPARGIRERERDDNRGGTTGSGATDDARSGHTTRYTRRGKRRIAEK